MTDRLLEDFNFKRLIEAAKSYVVCLTSYFLSLCYYYVLWTKQVARYEDGRCKLKYLKHDETDSLVNKGVIFDVID